MEEQNTSGKLSREGVFEYIKTFFKIKQETSGWLSWCKTEQDQGKYVTEYYATEGIELETEKKNIIQV